MKNYDEEAKKRREARHQEVREGFIKNLNALMYERNYSCQQLSINIGKNISYINRILNNKIMPSIEVLADIADVFGIGQILTSSATNWSLFETLLLSDRTEIR